jgi:hypothetical protein
MRWCLTALFIKRYGVTNFLAGRSNPGRGRIFFAFTNVLTGSVACPSAYSVGSFPRAKWMGREVDRCLYSVDRDNFTFAFVGV